MSLNSRRFREVKQLIAASFGDLRALILAKFGSVNLVRIVVRQRY